MQKSSFLK